MQLVEMDYGMASMQSRIERLALMTSLLPWEGGRVVGLSLAMLKQKLVDELGSSMPSDRQLQRDLAELIKDGTVAVIKDDGGIPHYVRKTGDVDDRDEVLDEETWEFLLGKVKQELACVVSSSQLSQFFDRLRLPSSFGLSESKLRILPDSLRLMPAHMSYEVLGEILRALKSGKALQVTYRSREGNRSDPVLHPQGLLQRGPRVYLYALKDDEEFDRMYAVDRIVSASMMPLPARSMPDFDLDQRVRDGRADFANGEVIQLKAHVRGYVEQLLYDCPLAPDGKQTLVPQVGGGSLLSVETPVSGQLLRWLLAGGCNIVVQEPIELRDVIAGQVKQLQEFYSLDSVS